MAKNKKNKKKKQNTSKQNMEVGQEIQTNKKDDNRTDIARETNLSKNK